MLDPVTAPPPATGGELQAEAGPGASSPQPAAAAAEPAFDREDPRYAIARQWAEGAGLPLAQLDGLAAAFADHERREIEATGEAERLAVQELARDWGPDLEGNVTAVCDWIDATAQTAGEREALAALTATAAGCRVAFRLAQGGRTMATTASGAQRGRTAQTEADKKNYAAELVGDPRYRDTDNRAYHAYVKREFARLWPGQVETAPIAPSSKR